MENGRATLLTGTITLRGWGAEWVHVAMLRVAYAGSNTDYCTQNS